MDKCITSLQITSYMSDIRYKLRAVSFMELAQEIAGEGADRMSFGDRHLASLDAVWVLARMHVKFVANPERYDRVTLETWHRGLKGAQYLRDYQMKDSKGEVMVASTSSWLIMDMKDRRMLYGDVLEDYVPSKPQCTEKAIERPCQKLIPPSGMEMQDAGSHKVCYSDVDYNRHTNNTKYIQWALDVLPDSLTYHKDLDEFQINFNKESHARQTVDMLCGVHDGVWYVEGRDENDQQVFICTFKFKD